jgi:hypothetical protein
MFTERYTEIERENRILLEKMTHIMQKKNDSAHGGGSRSLNRDVRKKELLRITMEN